jgi:hypothetical protein
VLGLDQHRAQVAYGLLDTETGEVRGGRVGPADRGSFRAFLRRFEGERLVAALERTGWWFLVEELRAVGAEVHLAEPAEASERRGGNRARLAIARKLLKALLPHPLRARRGDAATGLTGSMRARALDQLINRGRVAEASRRHAPALAGPERPERPHRPERDHPLTHHVAGPDHGAADRDMGRISWPPSAACKRSPS